MEDDLKSASDSLNDMPEQTGYKPSPVKAPKQRSKLPFITIASVFALAVLGFAVWKLVLSKPKDAAPTAETTTTTVPTETKSDVSDEEATETYTSTALSLDFKYPKSWKVTEAEGGIRVDSPQFSYPAANLGSVDGLFRVYIRQGARKVDGQYIGDGLAIKPSEKLVYTQPANGQRTDTLLSSFGNNSTDIFSFFLIAGNFQLNKGDTLGPDYGSEPETYIIAGGYTTTTAVDDLAMNSVALDYYATTNAYRQAIGIIGSLQLNQVRPITL